MPAPTRVYELVITQFTVESGSDMTQVNDMASQGYSVDEMLTIGGGSQPGGFVFLMSRTVTNLATQEESGTTGTN
jgi:hypothetical protein